MAQGAIEESANFYRTISMVVDVGSDVLRDLITTLIPLNTLAKELQNNILTLNRLKQVGVLHQDQYDMLTKPDPNPEEFDISLLVVLLRNICPNVDPPVGGWTIKYPALNDFTLGAELLRLRNIRNCVYAHRTSTRLNEVDFETTWKELTGIILRISKHGSHNKDKEVLKSIDEMRHRILDPLGAAEKLSLKLFQKWQNELDETVQTAKLEIIGHLDKQHDKLEESYELMKEVQHQVSITNLQMLSLQKERMDKNTMLQHNIIDSMEYGSTQKSKTGRAHDTDETHAVYATETQEYDADALNQLCVTLIKMYPWLKDEMDKTDAVCIASKLLSRDHTESICNSNQRRMAVDMLLKIVIKNKVAYLSKFFDILNDHWEPRDMLKRKMETIYPTEEEIEAFIRLNDSLKPRADPVQKPCMIETRDRDSLVFQVKDIVTEDTLNNTFLSNLFFSLQDHDNVCDYLHNSDLPGGAKCLIHNMEKCPISIMQTFCEMMESLGRGYVIQALDLKRKYCKVKPGCHDNKTSSSDENYLYPHAIRNFKHVKTLVKDVLGFLVTGINFGSVIYHLRPTTDNSWDELHEKCVSGQMLDILEVIFVDDEVKHFLVAGEYSLEYTVYSVQNHKHQNKAQRMACLKLDLISRNRIITKARTDSKLNPIDRNMDLLCDELDLSDDLTELLKRKNLVSDDVSAKLKQIESRAGRIRYLLMQMSPSGKGYETIKEYLRHSNIYLHHELDKHDNEELKREVVYQCETNFKKDFSDFESRFQFHSRNHFPVPEPLSQIKKTYPSRRATNAVSSRRYQACGRLVIDAVR